MFFQKPFGGTAVGAPRGGVNEQIHFTSILEELAAHVSPVVQPRIARLGAVVRRGEEKALAAETVEVAGAVVDEEVRGNDALVTAKYDMGIGEIREVRLDPGIFLVERAGELHGCGGDEDFVEIAEFGEDFGAAEHQWNVAEEAGTERVMAKAGAAVGRDDVCQLSLGEVSLGEVLDEFAIVLDQELSQGVGQDFVHVNGNPLLLPLVHCLSR